MVKYWLSKDFYYNPNINLFKRLIEINNPIKTSARIILNVNEPTMAFGHPSELHGSTPPRQRRISGRLALANTAQPFLEKTGKLCHKIVRKHDCNVHDSEILKLVFILSP